MRPRFSVYGIALARFRYWDSAAAALQRAWRLAPQDTGIVETLLDVYLQQGAFPAAIQLAQQLLATHPDSAKLHYRLGWAYSRLPQAPDAADQAVRHLMQAAELDPGWFEPYAEVGRIYKSLGRNRIALAAFEHAWRLNPAVPGVAYNLAALWRQVGDVRAAGVEQQFRRLMRNQQQFTLLRKRYNTANSFANTLSLAAAEEKAGLYAPALYRLRKMLAADPANLRALQLYRRIDQKSRAGYPDYLRPGPGIGPDLP